MNVDGPFPYHFPGPNGEGEAILPVGNTVMFMCEEGEFAGTLINNSQYPLIVHVSAKRFVPMSDISDAWDWYMNLKKCSHGKFEHKDCQECDEEDEHRYGHYGRD